MQFTTNEELETTNEELHSTNEKLETMNEELQSTNEELEAINNELRDRSSEVTELNQFLQSILGSMTSAVVVLGSGMQIRAWNRQAEELWGLRSDEVLGQHFLNLDIGFPVESLGNAIRACLAGREARAQVISSAVNRRGRSIDCEVEITCMPADGGSRGVILMMDAQPQDGAAKSAQDGAAKSPQDAATQIAAERKTVGTETADPKGADPRDGRSKDGRQRDRRHERLIQQRKKVRRLRRRPSSQQPLPRAPLTPASAARRPRDWPG